MVLDTLSYVGEKLNNTGILWGVGASLVLNQYGLISYPNDIDILVDIKDIRKTDEILKNLGIKKPTEETSIYSTKYFYEYVVNDIDIDVMAGFAINYDKNIYEYSFDSESITDIKSINGVNIPFTSLEDWYILYQLIPNKENKVNMIEKYLLYNGIKNTFLINRALSKELPNIVREKVQLLLRSQKYGHV